MEVRAFVPQDLYALSLQRQQSGLRDLILGDGYAEALAEAGPAYTATAVSEGGGELIVACIGTIPQWQGYQRAWALLSGDAGRCMVPLTRGISRWLRFHNEGRVDTAVDCTFEAAIRWAKMLGFKREGVMEKYRDGRDFYLYAQVT